MLRAFVFGFLASMPIGPTTVMFCRMALQKQFTKAWMIAFGVACADIFLSYLAGMGSRLVTFFVAEVVNVFGGLDSIFLSLYALLGLILMAMSFFVWRRPLRISSDVQSEKTKNFPIFLSSFLMTFLNPAAFVAFSALLPFFGLHDLEYWGFTLVMIGLGAMAWWTVLLLIMKSSALAQSKIFSHMHEVMAVVLFILGSISFIRFFGLLFPFMR